jgi:phosphoribosylamine---glycine ligase
MADDGVDHIVVAPGNAGIALDVETRPVAALDPDAVAQLAKEVGADLVIVGPEAPLVAGVADPIRAAGIDVFGPSKQAAQLEGSKAFAKDVMAAAAVPTALARICDTLDQVATALDAFGPPYVVKDDGLAAGKGVVVTTDRDEALAHAEACKGRVVVEEFLDGPEVSVFGITDGTTVIPLAPSQDFKRVGDDDQGPNTGGMGAYSPLDWAPKDLVDTVMTRVLQPTVDEMRRRGTPFSGLLYAGLALTQRGVRVVEFNARFGDPETQVVLARLVTPLSTVLTAAAKGTLAELEPLRWSDDAAVTVVVASAGYPTAPRAGDPIEGLDAANEVEGVTVLHAGTAASGDSIISAGGRVLSVTATAPTLHQARARAYEAVRHIRLEGSHHRTDIAAQAAGSTTAADAR